MSEETKHSRTVGEMPVSSALPSDETAIPDGDGWNTDDEVLAALGYR
jgi:hypothetical protein